MAEEKKEAYEFSIAGFKLKLNSTFLAMAIPIATTVGGAMWGAFEFYKDYTDMKVKIQKYVAPDLSTFDKRLAVIEENSQKTTDYTRDIKNDLKNDLRKLEQVVDQVERTTKQSGRETEQEIRALRKEVDTKIQKALDNPLAK
jgi:hypothetical protein